ncbi:SDR family NAD(P)-dependent oxidoreductase [Streptomyces iconiensis]|uniref:SDR family NAD(P)-dependent oxidoreductase n=1 Tax=Streptomyces iconiensis TaxID=1384038 RepID=A0ABT6ZNU8_9ACTN|nr:SDR family NAD(P)-dependent oxidoreductase [Streptomyces iconiensis]MDJ1130710.1 SDR family NAD(P)-dependent oxidoreductase [Streptomyces iconiensis]
MSAETVVVTGGASGLGLVTARHLVRAGKDVILVGRDAARTAAAAEGLRGVAPEGSAAAPPRTYTADLSQWSQVRDLAARLAADGIRIHVLVNNAGAAFPRYEQTADGAERTYALNHHAPFLLTHTLLAAGAFTADARIVNVSTFVEKRGRLDAHAPDVTGTSWKNRFYSQLHVYGTSKLLALVAAGELARRLPDGMRIYNANPGMVKGTGMNAHAGGLMRLTAPLFRPFSLTPDEGVRTALWLATTSPAPSPNGGFYTNSQPDTPSRPAQDPALARIVYERTASLLGVEELVGEK